MTPTIYARATAPGVAGVAVIRISGPAAFDAAQALCGALPAPGTARLRVLRDAAGEALDEALVLTFEEGASFTGARTVELQCHGAPAVVDAVLAALGADPRLRAAEAGEFARMAFENGRIDLIGLEGLAALLAAETQAQRRQAAGLTGGRARHVADGWAARLREALALLEGAIEFSEDVPDEVVREAAAILEGLDAALRAEIAGLGAAERLSEGFRVAVIGPPNMGKSTLINHIAGRDAAIVTDVPGTTRDLLEVRLDLGGLPVTLIDTAGLREAADEVERIGVARARAAADEADLVIRLTDGDEGAGGPDEIVVRGKSDLGEGDVSGLTGAGVRELLAEVERRLSSRVAKASVFPRPRQAERIMAAAGHVAAALAQITVGGREEMVSADLWSASQELDRLVGRLDIEDVLDDVFGRFCIGK